MQLICPQCHTNNRFGAERPAGAARFVCVGCRTEFDAVLVDGALRTMLPQDARGLAPFAEPAAAPEPDDDIFDILSIPQQPLAEVVAEPPRAQVLEDVFAGEALVPEVVHAPAEESRAAESSDARAAAPQESAPAAPAVEAVPSGAEPPAHSRFPPTPAVDKYAVGMRVLRVSPAWLVLSSIGFFAVLLTLSWVSQPVGPVGEAVAAAGVKLPNQATNPAPKVAASAPAAGVEGAKATAEKAVPPAPKEAEKPAAEAAPAPAAQPAPQHFSKNAGGGNFTVQVGSYSDPSEANQRVSQLRGAGFESRAVAVELPQRGTWYRVQAGRFETREEAAKAGAQMRARGAAAAAIVTEVGAQ